METARYFSPRKLAEAIGVSESSLKRWADDGLLEVHRTAGGHRRIPREEAIRFIRNSHTPLLKPEILGFTDLALVEDNGGRADEDALFAALRDGDARMVFGLLQAPFLAGRELSEIFDGPLRGAMHRIGELWRHDPRGIPLEHRATDLAIQGVMQIRLSLPQPRAKAPVAVGGAGTDDPYMLPSLMAATVLHELGYATVNLGPQTPARSLAEAAAMHAARLAWLSLSTEKAVERLESALPDLLAAMESSRTRLIVGGRAANLLRPRGGSQIVFGNSMAELAAYARGMMTAAEAGRKATTAGN